jgi:TetR/AcrR family transcriptional regulator of autoinduction and epiphytic fitness
MTNDRKPRKKRDTSQKHKIILEGAIQVFIENGFEVSSMDKIAEVAGVSKRTIYNHFNSKEVLFQAIVADFLKQREAIKPIKYSTKLSLGDQLKEFARAELYLIDDPTRRGLSKLFTSVFLMDVEFGKATRSQYNPHQPLILWLESAKADGKLNYQSPELAARIFYGMVEGCLTYPALFTDGASLKNVDILLDEIIDTFLCRFGS